MLNKLLYNTILSQTLSPCHKYLVAGNVYGQLAVYDIKSIFEPPSEQLLMHDFSLPKAILTIKEGVPINALVSTNHFLIIGTVGIISGYDWKCVTLGKINKPAWIIKLPLQDSIDKIDINSLWLDEQKEHLYVGCGDNNIYKFLLEGGRLVKTFEGHTDYIHSVVGRNNELVSASEDGSVKLWDIRTNRCHNTIEPHKNKNLSRSELGKWIGAASLEGDWIICGGGPRLALWHIRSLEVVNVFNLPDRGIHIASFLEENILAGGTAKHLYQLNYNGDVVVELPVSSTTVYSVLTCKDANKFLSAAGSSADIDFCTSFNYRDQVLHFR